MSADTQPRYPLPDLSSTDHYVGPFLGHAGRFDVWGDKDRHAKSPVLLVEGLHARWWGPHRGLTLGHHGFTNPPTPHEWCLIYEITERYTAGIPQQPEGN